MTKFCNYCGTENNTNADFCSKCGNKMPKIFRDGLKNKNILKIGIMGFNTILVLFNLFNLLFYSHNGFNILILILGIIGIILTVRNNINTGIIFSIVNSIIFGLAIGDKIFIAFSVMFFIALYYSQRNYKIGGIVMIVPSLIITLYYSYIYAMDHYIIDYSWGPGFLVLVVIGIFMLICGILTIKNIEKIPILDK